MFNSQFIEVGIGLIFVFLLMSIMVSSLNEAIGALLDQRGKQLKDAIFNALKDSTNKNWANSIYEHPLINSLKRSEKKLPSYIDSSIFSKAMIDVIMQENSENTNDTSNNTQQTNLFQKILSSINQLEPSDTKTLLLSFANDANGDYEKLKANIESWYNSYMDRVSGWYKRKTKKKLIIIGLFMAILMNVDTINVSTNLWSNAVLRESIANAADGYAKSYTSINDSLRIVAEKKAASNNTIIHDTTFQTQVENIKAGYQTLNMLNLPIGWKMPDKADKINNLPRFERYIAKLEYFAKQVSLSMILGWVFTAIAVSFGAPMWFDVLNKFINLRHSIKDDSDKK